MGDDLGAFASEPGSRASHRDAKASRPKASIPRAIQRRSHFDLLAELSRVRGERDWFESCWKAARGVSDGLIQVTGATTEQIIEAAKIAASAIEARQGGDGLPGSVHESVIGEAETPNPSPTKAE